MAAAVIKSVKKRQLESQKTLGSDIAEKEKGPALAEPDETWSERRLMVYEVACSHKFEVFCGAIILFNMFLVILETDASADDGSPDRWIEVTAYLLLAFYTCELTMKLYIFHISFFYEPWNVLDFCIVGVDLILLIMGFIISNMPSVAVLRVFRLVRLARAFKAAKQFQELHALIRSFGFAMKAIFWGILMIVMILTIWSILAVQLLHPINKRIVEQNPFQYEGCSRCPHAFSSVFESILTFFQHVVAGDSWGNVSLPIIREEPWTSIFFLMVLVTVNLTMLNLILAVIVEAGAKATEEDMHDKAVQSHKRTVAAEARLIEICSSLDEDASGSLNIEEFLHGFENNAEFADCLQAMNVSQSDINMIFNICDEDGSGDVNYVEFVDQLRRIRRQGEQMLLYYVTEIRHKVQIMKQKLVDHMDVVQTKLLDPLDAPDCQTAETVPVDEKADGNASQPGDRPEQKWQDDQGDMDSLLVRPAPYAEQKAGTVDGRVITRLEPPTSSSMLGAPEPKADLVNRDGIDEMILGSSRGRAGPSQAALGILSPPAANQTLGTEQMERLMQINQEIASVMQDVVSQSKVHTGLLKDLASEIPRQSTTESIPNIGGRCCGPSSPQPVQLL